MDHPHWQVYPMIMLSYGRAGQCYGASPKHIRPAPDNASPTCRCLWACWLGAQRPHAIGCSTSALASGLQRPSMKTCCRRWMLSLVGTCLLQQNPQRMLLCLCRFKTRIPCQVLRSLICWQGMIRLRKRNSCCNSSGVPCECTDSRTQQKTRALLTAVILYTVILYQHH